MLSRGILRQRVEVLGILDHQIVIPLQQHLDPGIGIERPGDQILRMRAQLEQRLAIDEQRLEPAVCELRNLGADMRGVGEADIHRREVERPVIDRNAHGRV